MDVHLLAPFRAPSSLSSHPHPSCGTLRRIGLREATDLDGGFQAWKAAGLPTRPAQPLG